MTAHPHHAAETRTGLLSALLCYFWWGALLPVFLIALKSVPADQVLVHRIVWSVPFGALIIIFRKQIPEVARALQQPKVMLAMLGSAAMIAVNWLIYIIAVQNERLFEAALGYYINPLVYVLVGVVLLGEKLTPAKQAAVGLATIGVAILTLYGGQFPTVSLILAVTFTAYGLLRKLTPIGAMPGLFIETLILTPVALGWLFFGPVQEAPFGQDAGLTALLIAAGPMTVIPLLAFAIAAKRLPLSVIGFLQFIGPTLQFVVGLLAGEAFTRPHQLCFAFIWTAVAVFAFDSIRTSRNKTAVKG